MAPSSIPAYDGPPQRWLDSSIARSVWRATTTVNGEPEEVMTAEIVHRIGIGAPPAQVYRVLATRSGLINWWTWHISGEPTLGGIFYARLSSGMFHMKVLELAQDCLVRWKCTEGPKEWVDTEISFTLVPEDRETVVHFVHAGWLEKGDIMAHSNSKWGYYLFSLKGWVEDGRGSPYPEDRKISSWG